jgi:hypothetical protein
VRIALSCVSGDDESSAIQFITCVNVFEERSDSKSLCSVSPERKSGRHHSPPVRLVHITEYPRDEKYRKKSFPSMPPTPSMSIRYSFIYCLMNIYLGKWRDKSRTSCMKPCLLGENRWEIVPCEHQKIIRWSISSNRRINYGYMYSWHIHTLS